MWKYFERGDAGEIRAGRRQKRIFEKQKGGTEIWDQGEETDKEREAEGKIDGERYKGKSRESDGTETMEKID